MVVVTARIPGAFPQEEKGPDLTFGPMAESTGF